MFFVRNLSGHAAYNERKEFDERPLGRKIAVTFKDGERLVGTTFTYDAARDGFFLFPADANSNNERIYVVMHSVSSVEKL